LKRVFTLAPPLLIAVYAATVVASGADMHVIYGSVLVTKLLAAVGLGAAAARYNRREYLFWAWALMAGNYALLFFAEVLFSSRMPFRLGGPLAPALAAVFVVAANVMGAVAYAMLARVWRVVGVALPDQTAGKKIFVVAGIVVAVALVGFGTIPSVKAMLAGQPDGFIGVFGSACDLVGFSLIAPLALRALAMRGGTLAWPWGLVAVSALVWMLFDFSVDLNLPVSQAVGSGVANGERVAACACAFAAGIAQRWAIRSDGNA
jgi:hypothetical protein